MREVESVQTRDAIKVGLAQAVALAPGVSRSGVTITAGRMLGLTRDAAARFSFLLLVPATAGAVVLKGAKVAKDGLPPGSVGPVALGIVAAAISGYFAIAGLLGYVRRRNYDVFVAYRLIAAVVVGLLIISGLKSATF
jgi:undecaprenyl-diphosphatase